MGKTEKVRQTQKGNKKRRKTEWLQLKASTAEDTSEVTTT